MARAKRQPATRRILVLGALGVVGALLLIGAVLLWTRRGGDQILGQAELPYLRPPPGAAGQAPQVLVIRSLDEYFRALGMPGDGKTLVMTERFFLKAFGRKAVDFDRHMLLVVTGGMKPTGGYRVEVTGLELDKAQGALKLSLEVHPPSSGQPVSPRPSCPATLVLVKRFDGAVKLEPTDGAAPKPAGLKMPLRVFLSHSGRACRAGGGLANQARGEAGNGGPGAASSAGPSGRTWNARWMALPRLRALRSKLVR
jgi:hypothetical protein